MPDDQTPRASAVELAYRAIRRSILAGDYPPHARLTEHDIAAVCGVSRTPVREALRRLAAEGLVVFSRNQGATVAGWTERDAQDVFALREMLESYAVACAAERIDQAGLDRLRALATEIRDEAVAAQPGYIARLIDLNACFHRLLIDAADSARLRAMIGIVLDLPLIARAYRGYARDELLRSAAQHLEIVEALQARDGPRAAAAMREHIQFGAELFRLRNDPPHEAAAE